MWSEIFKITGTILGLIVIVFLSYYLVQYYKNGYMITSLLGLTDDPKTLAKWEEVCKKYKCEASLLCNYLEGNIPQSVKDVLCYLTANEDGLLIVMNIDSPALAYLSYKKINKIETISRRPRHKEAETYGLSMAQDFMEIVTVSYISESNEYSEISFLYNANDDQYKYNDLALEKCNIIEYVKSRLPAPSNTTINL